MPSLPNLPKPAPRANTQVPPPVARADLKVEIEYLGEDKKDWVIHCLTPFGKYDLPCEDALICISDARHVNVKGGDGLQYRIPKGSLCSKRDFPTLLKHSNPRFFIEFKSDPKQMRGRVNIIIPKYSAT